MADPVHTNYYDVLGVAHTATAEDIKAAFLKLAAEYHAQGKPTNIEAVEKFRTIVRAYHVLGNEEQRNRYDRLGEAGVDPRIFFNRLRSGLFREMDDRCQNLESDSGKRLAVRFC